MEGAFDPAPAPPRTSSTRVAAISLPLLLASATLAALVMAGAIDGAAHVTSGSALWPGATSGDNVGDGEIRLRTEAFAAMAPLHMTVVSSRDLPAAIDGMMLAPDARATLEHAVAPTPAATAPAAALATAPKAMRARPVQLVWLTLWDTDVEDGDVVRIDSAGYSRTVTLAKKPLTFAVPAPADGVVKVTGVTDGDGGGITVGLASGASTAVFPVMSPGQALGLRVALE